MFYKLRLRLIALLAKDLSVIINVDGFIYDGHPVLSPTKVHSIIKNVRMTGMGLFIDLKKNKP